MVGQCRLLRSIAVLIVALCPVDLAHGDDTDGCHSSICSIADSNGDGVPELLLASRERDRDIVWMLSGKDGSVLHTLTGRAGDGYGCSLARGGDFDRDGTADFLVAARGHEFRNPYFEVRSGKNAKILFAIETERLAHKTAVGIAGDGDFDADGVPDVLIGCPQKTTGAVRAYSGRDKSLLATFLPPADETEPIGFGTAVAFVGEVDGEPGDDIVIGSPGAWARGRGSLSLFSGSKRTRIARIVGEKGDSNLGWSLRSLKDLDGDGTTELLVGAINRYALVVSCPSLRTKWRFGSRCGWGYQDSFGSSLDLIGDLDQDGKPEIVIGANETWIGMFDEGYIHVYSGATGERLFLELQTRTHGVDVAAAGDVDGDGWPDVAISSFDRQENQLQHTHSIAVYSGKDWKCLRTIDVATLHAAIDGVKPASESTK